MNQAGGGEGVLELSLEEKRELLKRTHTKKLFYTTKKVLVEVFPDTNINQPQTVFMEPYILNDRKILVGVYFDRLYVNLNPTQN